MMRRLLYEVVFFVVYLYVWCNISYRYDVLGNVYVYYKGEELGVVYG